MKNQGFSLIKMSFYFFTIEYLLFHSIVTFSKCNQPLCNYFDDFSSIFFTTSSEGPSSNFCWAKISNNLSVAVGSRFTGIDRLASGNLATVSSVFWCVYGVQTPCIDGQSVCQVFRNRIALEFWFCVRIKSIHLVIVSSGRLATFFQCRSPFRYSATNTDDRWRRGFTYTTTPGFFVEKSKSWFSMKSLNMKIIWKNSV